MKMISGIDPDCCGNCLYLRGDYEPYVCARKLNKKLNSMYDKAREPTADEVLELIVKCSVSDGDLCQHWRWYGDE